MREQIHSIKRYSIAIAVYALLTTGCANLQPRDTLNDPEIDLKKFAAITTMEAVSQLENEFHLSQEKELNYYAPNHFSTANKALSEAKTLLEKNGPRDQIVHKVAVADAVLKNGDRFMHKVRDILGEEVQLKERLESLNSQSIYRNEYGSLVERLNGIIQGIETGKAQSEENTNREKLIQDMQKLQRRAIRYNAMHEPQEILKRVKYRGGEKLAPITYLDAVEVFRRAEEFIAQNPNYEIGIEQIGREALFAAKRALYITEEVASLSQKFSISAEQIILDEEYRLYRVARELSESDFRDHPLEVQSEMLAKEAKSKASEIKSKDDLVIALRDTLIKVRDSSSRLSSISDTAKQLKKEKGEWLAKEALFKAKVVELEQNLAMSQNNLNQTQEKLLATNAAQEALSEQIEIEKAEKIALSERLEFEKQKLLNIASQTGDEKSQTITELNTVLNELAIAKQSLETVQSDKLALEDQLNKEKETSTAISDELAQIKSQIDLEKQLSQSAQSDAKTTLDEMTAQLASNRISLENSQKSLASLEEEKAQLSLQLSEANNNILMLKDQLAANETAAESNQLSASQKEKDNAEALAAIKAELEASKSSLQLSETDKTQLALQLDEEKSRLIELSAALEDANKQIQIERELSDMFQSQVEAAEAKAIEEANQRELLQTRLNELESSKNTIPVLEEVSPPAQPREPENNEPEIIVTQVNLPSAEEPNEAEAKQSSVSEEETLKALESAKELISILQDSSKQAEPAQNENASEAPPETVSDTSEEFYDEDDDEEDAFGAFADADE